MKYEDLRKRITILLLLILVSAALWFLNLEYPHVYLAKIYLNQYIQKGFQTFFALTIIYFIFKLIFEEAFTKGIKDYKTRYSFKQAVSVLYFTLFLLIIISIWLGKIENLLIAYGLIGAGIAIALQDLFKNFVGGVIIFVTGVYRVGI